MKDSKELLIKETIENLETLDSILKECIKKVNINALSKSNKLFAIRKK